MLGIRLYDWVGVWADTDTLALRMISLGQFYCTPCGRHFIDAKTRDVHLKTKVHKRRMKDVAQKQYTQKEADAGAGKTVEKYTPAHPQESDDMDDL